MCVCIVSRYVCDINDMRALGTMQNCYYMRPEQKRMGHMHTCFELRRSEAQIFVCLRDAAYIFRYYLANEINMHMYKKVATSIFST